MVTDCRVTYTLICDRCGYKQTVERITEYEEDQLTVGVRVDQDDNDWGSTGEYPDMCPDCFSGQTNIFSPINQ
jgi:hypothetical protein